MAISDWPASAQVNLTRSESCIFLRATPLETVSLYSLVTAFSPVLVSGRLMAECGESRVRVASNLLIPITTGTSTARPAPNNTAKHQTEEKCAGSSGHCSCLSYG